MIEDNILIEIWQNINDYYTILPTIKEIKVGLFYVAAFTDLTAGIAYLPPKKFSLPNYTDTNRFMENMLRGQPFYRAIGTAVLNAFSWIDMRGKYKICDGDPLKNFKFEDKIITTVGRFPPLVKSLTPIVREFRIIEKETFEEEGIIYFSDKDCDKAFMSADIVIITGSSLVYGGIEKYLKSASKHSPEVLVIGPTSSLYPGPFFDRGASIVAGVEIFDSQKLSEIINNAGTPAIIKNCARKVYAKKSENLDRIKINH